MSMVRGGTIFPKYETCFREQMCLTVKDSLMLSQHFKYHILYISKVFEDHLICLNLETYLA